MFVFCHVRFKIFFFPSDKFQKWIGTGQFGDVWTVVKDEKIYALKMTNINDERENDFEFEFASHLKTFLCFSL
jgi:hypothetical protein